MVRPARERPGFSRRDQNRQFIAYLIAIGGIMAGLLLAIVSVVDPVGFSALRSAAREVATPVARAGRTVTSQLAGLDDSIAAYFAAGSQNQQLRRELDETRRQLVAASNLTEENRQLRKLLDLQEQQQDAVAHGFLMSSSVTSVRRFAALSIGQLSGVAPNMSVRAADGLIGRVVDAGPNSARVMLLTDASSVVPVRRASDGLPAMASGRGLRDLEIRTLNIANNPFRPGDILVTSGIGGVFRPNVPVAIIVRRDAEGGLARPLAEPATADVVAVLPEYAAQADRTADNASGGN